MKTKRWHWIVGSATFLALSAFVFARFMQYHEVRMAEEGIVFNDWLMNQFPVADCSLFIFSITYGSILLYIVLEYKNRLFASKMFIGYGILLLLRIVALLLVPLKAPVDLVYLNDPFLNNYIYPSRIVTDLFFSGHTGLVFMLFFTTRKWIFAVLGTVLGVLLMVQRVHYSIDIIGAIPIAYIIARVVESKITHRWQVE